MNAYQNLCFAAGKSPLNLASSAANWNIGSVRPSALKTQQLAFRKSKTCFSWTMTSLTFTSDVACDITSLCGQFLFPIRSLTKRMWIPDLVVSFSFILCHFFDNPQWRIWAHSYLTVSSYWNSRWTHFEDTQLAHSELTRSAHTLSLLWAFHEFPILTVSSVLLLHGELIEWSYE